MLPATFAEYQPVIPTALALTLFQQRPQAGQPGAGADEDGRTVGSGQMKLWIATQRDLQRGTRIGMLAQPAGALTQAAIVIDDLAYDQFQGAILGQAGDGIDS